MDRVDSADEFVSRFIFDHADVDAVREYKDLHNNHCTDAKYVLFAEAQFRIAKQVCKFWCIDTAMETRSGCKAPALDGGP